MAKTNDRSGWSEPGRRWDEADAREALKALSESGMSAPAFARQHGFSAQRLRSWRPRLSESAAGPAASARLLVPLTVRGSAAPTGAQAPVVVVRAGGAVMEIRDVESVDPIWLARVMVGMGGTS